MPIDEFVCVSILVFVELVLDVIAVMGAASADYVVSILVFVELVLDACHMD